MDSSIQLKPTLPCRHSKRYIDVLYEKELENWLSEGLERDRKWRRVQAKLKHDKQKHWN